MVMKLVDIVGYCGIYPLVNIQKAIEHVDLELIYLLKMVMFQFVM